MRAVAITGLGATTPLGGSVSSTWSALLDGVSGVKPLVDAWAAELPIHVAAPAAADPAATLERTETRRLDRCQQFALLAAREAWADAGYTRDSVPPERIACVVGCGLGGGNTMFGQHDINRERGFRAVSPYTVPMSMPNGAAARVGLEVRAEAGVHAVASACATGSEAIANACDLINAGRADVVVAGGTEAPIHPSPVTAFAAMRSLSRRELEPERACRPFDKHRDGFVIAEGAGIVVLESPEHARARGARIYAQVTGAGRSSDAHHMVMPRPDAVGAIRAITMALNDSGLAAADIAHVNAHATATTLGDRAEVTAIRSALGTHPVVTAPKSMLGHSLGAAGALEAIITALSVHHGIVPPTINVDNPDNDVDLDIATLEPRRLEIPAAVSNSFGFGGHNVALVIQPEA